jgi:hypothetical protein
MFDAWPAVIAGACLIAFSMGSGWFQWRYRQPDDETDPLNRVHAARRLRLRLQVSVLLGVVGILIVLTDTLPAVRRSPVLLTFLVLCVLLLTLWIVALAVADAMTSRLVHLRTASRMRAQQLELEQQLAQYRAQASSASQSGSTYRPHELN